ncbi:glycosyltransferase [Anaerospora hongkongensis]|uniref:glycosyltransferase n=1 Tax=Anaerospora hongkongensis TaxID=244830 RepID=UPI00289CF224|nr:glycosyltransferase [Anaerospora hongkongensis]
MFNPIQLLHSINQDKMTITERMALAFLLESLRPMVSLQFGLRNEAVSIVSEYSQKVYAFGFSNNEDILRGLKNVVLVDHEAKKNIPVSMSLSSTDSRNIQFVFIDRESYRVKYDIESILQIRPYEPIYVLIYNSFNPECRKGILDVDWNNNQFVHHVEIDYTQGTFHEGDDYHKQMRGGFALAVLLPEVRSIPLSIMQSNRLAFDTVYKSSIHLEPFQPDKILLNLTRESLLKRISGKRIVFFGTGSASKKILEDFPLELSYYVDNDSRIWGTFLQDLEIRNPMDLMKEDKDNLAIIIASQYGTEIANQLGKMGFDENVNYWDGYRLFTMNSSLTQRYFIDKYVPADTFRRDPLKVSVIVPNYNYAAYLQERIYSIMNQSVQPFEIIFLDDASTDNSVILAKNLLETSVVPYRIVVNETNQSCFKQWTKGIEMAEGDIIWIAEADDTCRLDFLEEALAPFSDLEVNISYVQSKVIDSSSKVIDFDYIQYTDDISRTKWKSSYCQNGQDEVLQGLATKNTIPNASGVLMRRSALKGICEQLAGFSICGDWFTYLYTLKQGKIAFNAKPLNYHRRHDSSIIAKQISSVTYLKELWTIKKYITDNYLLSGSIHNQFIEQVDDELRHMNEVQITNLDKKFLNSYRQQVTEALRTQLQQFQFLADRKKIMLVILHLGIGGAEFVPIRLANYLAAFHDVYLYIAKPYHVNDQVKQMISPSVYQLPSSGDPRELAYYIKKYSIDAVNSHAWWADKLTYQALKELPNVNWVISMHGHYELLQQQPLLDKEFNRYYPSMMRRVNYISYLADKNTDVVYSKSPEFINKLRKVNNGYVVQSIEPFAREHITKDVNSYIFGIVSRAIPEKGWEESIQAIIQLNLELQQTHHLVLIGKSDYSAELRQRFASYSYVHFVEDFSKPNEWISRMQAFDVGLLPTYYVAESMPLTIIEYLAYKKPVISTNVGEIPRMLTRPDGKTAGILLNLDNNKISVKELVKAMKTMVLDKQKYNEYKQNTDFMFDQFSMAKSADTYFRLL